MRKPPDHSTARRPYVGLALTTLLLSACTGDTTTSAREEAGLQRITQALDTAGGSLDTFFGNGGKVISELPCCTGDPSSTVGRAVVLQDDGKIVALGDALSDFVLARHNPDGSLDTTFGNGGSVTTNFGGPNDRDTGFDLARQPDGKLVAVGSSIQSGAGPYSGAIARYNPADGSLDASFGVNGQVLVPPTAGLRREIHAVVILPDGKIAIAGANQPLPGGPFVFFVGRLTSTGLLDPTFGVGGLAETDFGNFGPQDLGSLAFALAAQADGKLILVGKGGPNMSIARFDTAGNLDAGFGTGGKVVVNFGVFSVASAVLVQPDGKIVVGGSVDAPAPDLGNFALVRLTSSGALDNTFGTAGKVSTQLRSVPSGDSINALARQADGKLIAGGRSEISFGQGTNTDFALVRYNVNGTLDPTFGEAGKVTTEFGDHENMQDLALQPDGKIVALGYHAGFPFRMALARYYGGNRILVSDFEQGSDGFTYQDDTFNGTSKPAYASGTRVTSGGFSGAALRVRLGNVDESDITNMSGGWRRTFNLPAASRVYVTFRHNIVQPPNLEPDEYARVMLSIDGDVRAPNGSGYLSQLTGEEGGEGGPDKTTGWQQSEIDLGNLAAGNHTLIFGGFANKKTATDERSDIFIDDVTIATDPATGQEEFLREDFAIFPLSWMHMDDAFKGTNQPNYADGPWRPTGGHTNGASSVVLGNVDNNVILGMSGAMTRTLTFSTPVKTAILRFKVKHAQSPNYESTEYTQTMFGFGSQVFDIASLRVFGDGNGGPDRGHDWVELAVALGPFDEGTYTLKLGAYGNRKDNVNEQAEILYDDILLTVQY